VQVFSFICVHNSSLLNEFVCKLDFFFLASFHSRFKGPRIHTGENSQILTVSKKIVIETYGRQKKCCMQLVSKVCFFYSADLRTRFARVANFPSRKKSITLLTCYINNYFRCRKNEKIKKLKQKMY
jgi:hypothetical protein